MLAKALAHADGLYNFARWLIQDPVEAEDLVQETYARALAAARHFESGSNLKAWLFRILRNTYLDRRRNAQREQVQEDGEVVAVGVELQFEQMKALVAEDVAEAVHALPEVWRSVILLELEGMTGAEIASVLGCAEGTVKSRLSRARTELRARLAAYRP